MSWMNVHMCVCSCHILNIYSMVLQVASNNFTSYEMGHLVLSGIDFRCHGFTEFMCGERVEYAWLMQLAFGRITGAFSTPQVRQSVCLRVCMYMYIYVRGIVCCEHGWECGVCNICAYVSCTQLMQVVDWLYTAAIHTLSLIQPKVEPLSEVIKYLLFNLRIASLDLHLNDDGPITRIQVQLPF